MTGGRQATGDPADPWWYYPDHARTHYDLECRSFPNEQACVPGCPKRSLLEVHPVPAPNGQRACAAGSSPSPALSASSRPSWEGWSYRLGMKSAAAEARTIAPASMLKPMT